MPSSQHSFASRFFLSRYSLAALATAVLWWFSLQRFGLFAFGWIAFIPLLYVLNDISSARSRFWFGWRAGVLCFALINWWILPTIIKSGVVIGAAPPLGAALGVLAVLLIGIVHGFGIAIIAFFWKPQAKFFSRFPLLLPVFIALCWYGIEVVRSTGVLAHSWGALAFSQWSNLALLQSASFLGQHGLSALCVWFAASLALWLKPEYSARVPNLWRAPFVVFLALYVWGTWRLVYDNTRKDGRSLEVLLVQTNVSSLRKNYERGESHFEQAERLTREYFTQGEEVNLIVWPETTAQMSMRIHRGNEEAANLSDMLGKRDATHSRSLSNQKSASLLVGTQVTKTHFWDEKSYDEYPYIYNSAVLFSADKEQYSSKMCVVPFGERAPFGEYLPFLNQLAPQPPVEPATSVAPLRLGSAVIGTLICFESCFPSPAKSLKTQGAQVLFTLTNDEWFAGTTAPWEHAAMSTLRAVENGVPVVQCANGGYSFVIDARGRFLEMSEYGKAGVLATSVRLR